MRTLVIVNPTSGGGAARRRFRRIEARVRAALGGADVEWTRGPRDAERLAREGVRAGVSRLVVAGGDGTVSEAVTGLLSAGLGGEAQLGILPMGTGGDLRRTLGIAGSPERALAALDERPERRIDAGRAVFADEEGKERERFFVNVGSLGISGLTTLLVNRGPKQVGGRAAFLLGSVRAIVSYRPAPVELRVDGETLHRGPLVLATAANGAFFGGGMHVAPGARADDGLLDAVVVPAFSKPRLLAELPRIYAGTHLRVAGVVGARGRRIEALPLGEPAWVELDGEPVGRLPARFEVVPGALRVLGCEPGPA